jgi:multiple antibiotic resistance protein
VDPFTKSFALLLVLLNPFIMSVYLIDLVRGTDARTFARALLLAGAGSYVVFVTFAVAGDSLFTDVLQVRFVVRLILVGGTPIPSLRASSTELPGSIAVPFLIGPGTVSASVLAGSRLEADAAALAIGLALAASLLAIIAFKWIHDFVSSRNERLVRRYTEIAGRATALFTGSFAIEMILTGLETWLRTLPGPE